MNFNRRIKSIEKWVDKKVYVEEAFFDRDKLFELKFLNFQIDDCYYFQDQITGNVRSKIFKVLYSVYENWKKKLLELDTSFYLGVWIYDPRLPKSEIVCGIGKEKTDYYLNGCFDKADEQKHLIEVDLFVKESHNLKWSQKIDSDTLEEWEINFPKENYDTFRHWQENQDSFKKFIRESYKQEVNHRGKTYYKKVGDIWTGEFVHQ